MQSREVALNKSTVSSFWVQRRKTGKMDTVVFLEEASGSSLLNASIFSVRNKKQSHHVGVRKGEEVLMV